MVPEYEFAPVFKTFNWDRNYSIGYDLTKNIKAGFNATNRAIFEEGNHRVDRKNDPDGYRELPILFGHNYQLWKNPDYTHNYNLNITLPFNKIPATDWLTANVKY